MNSYKLYKDIVYRLLGNKCNICSKQSRILHIHHINHINTDNDIKNLQLLCSKCHGETHYRDTLRLMKEQSTDKILCKLCPYCKEMILLEDNSDIEYNYYAHLGACKTYLKKAGLLEVKQ